MIRCTDHYGQSHDVPVEKFNFRISAYGVLRNNNKLLVVKERWSKKWEFPGGGIKPSESITDGLQREIKEETGLTVRADKLLTLTEDYFYAEDRDEAWHRLRLIYTLSEIRGKLNSRGNSDDIVAAGFKSLSALRKDADVKSFIKDLLKFT